MTKAELVEMLSGEPDDIVILSKDATGTIGPAQFYPTMIRYDANRWTWHLCTDQTPTREQVKAVIL